MSAYYVFMLLAAVFLIIGFLVHDFHLSVGCCMLSMNLCYIALLCLPKEARK